MQQVQQPPNFWRLPFAPISIPMAALLILILILPADLYSAEDSPFGNWQEFARQRGDEELSKAVYTLEYLAPQLLYNAATRQLAMELIEESPKSRSSPNSPVHRKIEVLRLEETFQEERVIEAFDYLCKRGRGDQKRMSTLAKESFEKVNERDDFSKARTKAWIQRQALALPIDMSRNYPRLRANALRCWRYQKLIEQAVEKYEKKERRKVEKLDEELFERLKAGGYLVIIPDDPGYGRGSLGHYKLSPQGVVYCTHHGFNPPPKGCDADSTVREQLKAHGVKDENALDHCADIPLLPKRSLK